MKKNNSNKKTWLKIACIALIALVFSIGFTSEEVRRKVSSTSLALPEGVSEEVRESLREHPPMRASLYKLIFKFMSVDRLMEQVAELNAFLLKHLR